MYFSTHFMDEAEAACDTTVILHGGKTRCQGSSLFLKRHLGIHFAFQRYVFCESFAQMFSL